MKPLMILFMLGFAPACAQQKTGPEMKDKQLLNAATANDTTAIQGALAAGAQTDIRDSEGRTPLMLAVYRNNTAAARLLIGAGANVNAQDKILNSPFLYAGAEGYTEIVQLCMRSGADYTVYNRYGGSALIPACERGHVETVAALLGDKKFPIDHINRLGWTALLEAVILGNGGERHITVVKMLIAAGANVNIADKDGVTPLAHARNKAQREIAKLLADAGAK